MTDDLFFGYLFTNKKGITQMNGMRVISKTLGGIAAAVLAGAIRAWGGVYDDVAMWWQFDNDANNDGQVQVGEVKDQRSWDGTARHATTLNGPSDRPWITGVVSPAGGPLYGDKAMLFSPLTNATSCWPVTLSVNNFSAPGSATIVTRLRWDGYTFTTPISQIYFNGYGSGNGWIFFLYNGQPYFYTVKGMINIPGAPTLVVGKWYELALVITDNGTADKIEVYVWAEGGNLVYASRSGDLTASTATATTKIGCENDFGTYGTTDAAKRSFKGAINHVAVWNRALSYAEVCEALRAPYPDVFQVGLNNGSINDVGAASQTNEEYSVNAAWHTMRRSLTSEYPTLTMKVPVSAVQTQLNQVVHVDTLAGGSLKLVVNGVDNAVKTADQNQQICWLVPSAQLVPGTNTFTLIYAGTSGSSVGLDSVEIGGSWQLGTADGNYAELGKETTAQEQFYLTDPVLTNLEWAATSGDSDVNIHFSLSNELARKYAFTYTTRLLSQGGTTSMHPLKVLMNGVLVQSLPAQPDLTTVSLRIDSEFMKAGDNTLTVRYDDSVSGWVLFDYHRLEVRQRPGGTLFKVH